MRLFLYFKTTVSFSKVKNNHMRYRESRFGFPFTVYCSVLVLLYDIRKCRQSDLKMRLSRYAIFPTHFAEVSAALISDQSCCVSIMSVHLNRNVALSLAFSQWPFKMKNKSIHYVWLVLLDREDQVKVRFNKYILKYNRFSPLVLNHQEYYLKVLEI